MNVYKGHSSNLLLARMGLLTGLEVQSDGELCGKLLTTWNQHSGLSIRPLSTGDFDLELHNLESNPALMQKHGYICEIDGRYTC